MKSLLLVFLGLFKRRTWFQEMKAGSFGFKREWKRRRESEDGSEKKRGLGWGGEAKARWPDARGDAHLSSY